MIRDILHYSDKEIMEMDYIDYEDALYYSVSKFNLITNNKKKSKGTNQNGDHIDFDTPDDEFIDPLFVDSFKIEKVKKTVQ